MEYESEIKRIAGEIYAKVTKFVDENKGNDDRYYENAYLSIDSELQIVYSFDDGSLYITDKKGFNATWGFVIKIQNGETECWYKDYKYESSLEFKLASCQREKLKKRYEKELEKRKKLSDNTKKELIAYYEQFNKLADNMTYDRKNTENPDNFNYDTFNLYEEIMNNKELGKLAESKDTILPAVKVVVDWWAKTISRNCRGGSLGDDSESKLIELMANAMAPSEMVTDEQLKIFKDVLATRLMNEIYECDWSEVTIECDYGPDSILLEAMNAAKISPLKAPFKTDMYVKSYYVSVSEGYGADCITLYDATEKEDIEIVKHNMDLKQQNQSLTRTLDK